MTAWDDKTIELLKKLHKEGKSGRQIAMALGNGLSRNAIIGKLNRLGLSRGRDHRHDGPLMRRKKLRKNKPTQAQNPWPLLGKASVSSVPTAPYKELKTNEKPSRNLMELDRNDCRWPIGDPRSSDFGFCGCEAVPGLPYCETHRQRAYYTATPMSTRSLPGEVKSKREEDEGVF